ncbi:MAG: glycosyltransferase family 2 protein [Patescibacteria group bacterium]|jgi:glycosyltransferase involved in cell wall biosynthesis
MSKPLLSICITTLNRAVFLDACLASIVKQLTPATLPLVELIILDDNSKDETDAVVAKYTRKYRNVRYFKNPERVGLAKGIHQVSCYATGTYTWFFSDDDGMSGDALSTVLEAIKKKTDVMYLNIDLFTKDFKTLIQANLLHLSGNVLLPGKRDFFRFLGQYFPDMFTIDWFTTYLSNLIIRTKVIAGSKQDIDEYVEHKDIAYFPQLYSIFQNSHDLSFYIVKNSVVHFRSDNASYAKKTKYQNYSFTKRIYTHQYITLIKTNWQYMSPGFLLLAAEKLLFMFGRSIFAFFGI